jgi:hypothetical protein
MSVCVVYGVLFMVCCVWCVVYGVIVHGVTVQDYI